MFKKGELDNARVEELLNNEERANLEREVSKKEIEEELKSLNTWE